MSDLLKTMIQIFFKYQSLGNDFILLDWYKKSQNAIQKTLTCPTWKKFVIDSCNRHFGVGADGILILKNDSKLPEGLIFNADGSQAEICLNGLRCLTLHLFTQHNFSSDFKIKMGTKIIDCQLQASTTEQLQITNKIEAANYLGQKTIEIDKEKLSGHVVDVGNPHFIVFEKVDLEKLKKYGPLIEKHKSFKNGTNVEFVWQEKENSYQMLIHERGAGITLACSSGAAAALYLLFKLGKIKKEEKLKINMLGGQISCLLNKSEQMILQAPAQLTFNGSFEK